MAQKRISKIYEYVENTVFIIHGMPDHQLG